MRERRSVQAFQQRLDVRLLYAELQRLFRIAARIAPLAQIQIDFSAEQIGFGIFRREADDGV